MKNVTITLPEDVLSAIRVRAASCNLSVNRFLGEVIRREANTTTTDWQSKFDEVFEAFPGKIRTGTWNRAEINEERINRVR